MTPSTDGCKLEHLDLLYAAQCSVQHHYPELAAEIRRQAGRIAVLERALQHIADWEIHTGATGSIPPPAAVLDGTALAAVVIARAALADSRALPPGGGEQ